ncbi:biotin transporter BioY [Marinisporobacter balticus]|uniref:Biotin transporter n=1 Tax=Marinisporobacter balticus TaxID=2018667 RepID=A0A4R2KNT5_9FIRM|nr:biotin transporter BioY [Marinisporobacter balticus]TCO74382.1 biotin transport system substrate-specific component [Marinisporobacter balticus]
MKFKTRDMILVAMFAALTAIGAFIKIPTPIVPVTLQYLFCAFSGIFLGARLGLYSQLLYVAIGLSGIPIFAQGSGLSYVYKPTFGYLIGFMLCSYIIGKFTEKLKEVNFKNLFFPVITGLLAVYSVGVPYMYMIIRYHIGKPITFMTALKLGFFPFIIQDIFWSVLIVYTATKVIPSLRKAGYVSEKFEK